MIGTIFNILMVVLFTLFALTILLQLYINVIIPKKDFADYAQSVLSGMPIDIIFRTPECEGYTKFNCHIATVSDTNKRVLMIDLSK